MAKTTSKQLRNMTMYQVFVRNFSKEGSFLKVKEKLDEIRALGTDIVWLMPIHPVGEKQRKGSLGSPYAISDYRAVNPEFGTIEDLRELVDGIHDRGMKCIIDVVYNHTSPDSVLSREHPEWFYHRADGSFGNRVGDWSDIIDLDYDHHDLWRYQIDTLKMWAEIVDGFRCDVAPLIPLEFWQQAHKEVEEVRPGCIWLSESIEPEFITHLRGRGMTALSDSEIFQVFDLCYDYDVNGVFTDYLCGKGSLSRYAEAIDRQEYIYPENYVKLRFLENHDVPRAAFLIPDETARRNWTAFLYFQKGMTLIYAGQEYGISHLPSLFDQDTVPFDQPQSDDRAFLRQLAQIKRHEVFTDSVYHVSAVEERFLVAKHTCGDHAALGVFSIKGESAWVPVDFADGSYTDLISGKPIEVFRGGIQSRGEPIIIIA